MAVSLGVSQLLWIILSVIGSVSLLRDSCASLAASSRKRNAPSMTCWLKASDSPGPAVGGVHSRSSSYSNSIVVGVCPWSCIGSTAVTYHLWSGPHKWGHLFLVRSGFHCVRG